MKENISKMMRKIQKNLRFLKFNENSFIFWNFKYTNEKKGK